MGIDVIRNAAEKFGDEVALISPTRQLSFVDLDREVERIAGGVAAERGKCVSLAQSLTEELPIKLFALLRVGAVAAILNTRLPKKALELQREEVAALSDQVTTAATVLYTSGSSAQPKAIVHTLENHLASARGVNVKLALERGDRWLLSLPLYHVAGLAILFRCWIAGAAVVIPKTKTKSFNQEFTHISLVATQLQRLLEGESGVLSSLKACLVGGGPIPPSLLEQARHLPIVQSYGLTEMASTVYCAGSCLAEQELKIADEGGGSGEILIRGASLCKGILEGGEVRPCCDEEGWFHTRDKGYFDDEGQLHVVGRIDNLFISGGENIQPEEIEEQLLKLPGVTQAVVVPVDDPEFGQRPVAFLDCLDYSLEQVREYLEGILPRYKLPIALFPWPEDLNQSGIKVSRRILKEKASTSIRSLRGGGLGAGYVSPRTREPS